MEFFRHAKAGGQQDETLAARHIGEVLGQFAQRHHHAARAVGVGGSAQAPYTRVSVGRDGRRLDAAHHLFQPLGIAREVLRDLQGAAEIGDRHQAIRAGIGIDELRRGFAGLRLLAEVHGGVVEEEHQVAFLILDGGIGVGAEPKSLDGLLFCCLPRP